MENVMLEVFLLINKLFSERWSSRAGNPDPIHCILCFPVAI